MNKQSLVRQKKNIIITGVNGFLGQALWKYFKKYYPGAHVYGLTRKITSSERNVFVCDFKGKRQIGSILAAIAPDYVFHCAGGRMAKLKALREANVLSAKYLLEAVKNMKGARPRIIIPGSAAEYGKMLYGRKKIRESDRCAPLSVYGAVKFEQTSLALAYAYQGMDVIVARIFNIMGEGTPSALAAGRFAEQITQIEKGLSPKVIETKNLFGKRDFLDIRDVCAALLAVAIHGRAGQIYNICSGRPVTMKAVLGKFLSLAKVRNIVVVEDKSDASPSFAVIGSNAKLRSVSGWFPKVSLERSLNNTLRGYRQEKSFH